MLSQVLADMEPKKAKAERAVLSPVPEGAQPVEDPEPWRRAYYLTSGVRGSVVGR